jgi:signal transduction histidine kinase
MIASLSEIGLSYKLIENNKKALNYYLRAKNIAETENNYPRIINLNKEIANLHIEDKEFHKALIYLDLNFNIAKKLQDIKIESNALLEIGKFYIKKENPSKAIEILHQSYDLSKQTKDVTLISDITENLSLAYYNIKNLEKAYSFLKLSKEYTEKKIKLEEKKTFDMLRSIFEITNKEKEIELLRKTNKIQKLEKERTIDSKNKLVTGIISLIVVLILITYMMLYIRKKKKLLKVNSLEIEASNLALLDMNVNLQRQKEDLNKLNISLVEMNKRIMESEAKQKLINNDKDKLFSIISHDLRSPFSSIISFARIIKRDIEEMSKQELQELAEELEKTTNKINTLLENLLQWSSAQTGKIKFKPQKLNLNENIAQSIDLLKNYAKNKNINIINNINSDIYVEADNKMLSTIVRNLLSNAIKFSYNDSEIFISVDKNNNDYNISIMDNGIGISKEQIDLINDGNNLKVVSGTNDEKGSGLGLLICKEFLEKHSSSLNVHSEKGKGTVFSFRLKIGY